MKKIGAVISYISMMACIYTGFDKMVNYTNSQSSFIEKKNAYVGGDAYNFIINSNLSAAWFVLAGVCAIIGLTFVISYKMDSLVE